MWLIVGQVNKQANPLSSISIAKETTTALSLQNFQTSEGIHIQEEGTGSEINIYIALDIYFVRENMLKWVYLIPFYWCYISYFVHNEKAIQKLNDFERITFN